MKKDYAMKAAARLTVMGVAISVSAALWGSYQWGQPPARQQTVPPNIAPASVLAPMDSRAGKQSSTHASASPEASTASRETATAILALQRRLERMEQTQATLSRTLAELLQVEQGNEETPPPAIEDEGIEPEASNAELVDQFESDFFQQLQDSEWSADMERRIHQAWLDSSVPGSELVQASCRSTSCRVEIAHHDKEAEQQLIAYLAQLAPFASEGVPQQIEYDDGLSGTVLYFSLSQDSL